MSEFDKVLRSEARSSRFPKLRVERALVGNISAQGKLASIFDSEKVDLGNDMDEMYRRSAVAQNRMQ